MKFLLRRADLIVAVALSIMFATEMALVQEVSGPRWLNILAGVAVSLPLARVGRAPLATAVVVLGLAVLQSATLSSYFDASAGFLGLMWLTYRTGELAFGRRGWMTLAVIEIGNAVVGSLYDESGDVVLSLLAPLPLFLAGRGVAQRRRLNRELSRRAKTAERERDARAQLAAAEERVRIAGELQSIVIAEVRRIEDAAAVTRHAAGDPSAAARAFAEIAVTGRRGLDQMRALLGVLREARVSNGALPALADGAEPAPPARPRVRAALWSHTYGRLPDAAQDVAVALTWLAVFVLMSQTNPYIDSGWQSASVAAAFALALVWRRRSPVGVMAAIVAICVVAGIVYDGETRGVVALTAMFVPLFAAARHRGRIEERLGIWLPLLAAGAFVLLNPVEVWSDLLFPPLYLMLAYAFGRMMSNADEFAEVLDEEARQLEAARDALAQAAVVDERLRIARDLHDVGAHSLSTIVLQAEAGKRIAESNPEAAARAAATIATAARAALGEVESLVAGAGVAGGLDGVEALAEDARARGLEVRVEIEEGCRDLPARLDTVAFRVVQEALTNAAKHAGPTAVTVRVGARDGELEVHVQDDGPELAARVPRLAGSGGGHGLAGMRERVEMAGGSLVAGPREGEAGFAVRAVLPLPAPVPAV